MSLYGYCPQCGERGVRRERRLGGNDTCEAGHTYPTAQSHSQPDALIARLTRERSDHAAELAEWKQRAERAEAYVAGQDVRSDFRTAGEMRAALDDLRDTMNVLADETRSSRPVIERLERHNTLLRAECEAWRAWDRQLRMDLEGQVSFAGRYLPGVNRNLTQARAATDAAGILKGAGT